MASPRTIQTPRLGVGRTSLTTVSTNPQTSLDTATNDTRVKDTKCFIKVVLPTLDDGILSNAGKTSPEINLVTAGNKSPSPKPENLVSASHQDDFRIQKDHKREIESARQLNREEVGLNEENDFTSTLIKMYDEKIYRSSRNECDGVTTRGLEICPGKEKGSKSAHRRTNITQKTAKRTDKINANDKQALEKLSGNFVDIAAWQTDLEESPKTERAAKSNKLCDSSKHLRKGFIGSLGELPYIFDQYDDLSMYVKDYRQNNSKCGLGRNYPWDGTTKYTNKSINGLHGGKAGSSQNSRFGVKTTDPTAKSFLSQTHRYSADIPGGCVMCEKEKFRLRNSFLKRVYLSWNQYMTLCKSNSFLMSNEHHSTCNVNSPKWQSPPRAVTSHMSSRPLLTNRRDRSFEEQCKYDDGQTEFVEKKTSHNHQSGASFDKTLLVYRLSGKKRTPLKSGKSDLNIRNDLHF